MGERLVPLLTASGPAALSTVTVLPEANAQAGCSSVIIQALRRCFPRRDGDATKSEHRKHHKLHHSNLAVVVEAGPSSSQAAPSGFTGRFLAFVGQGWRCARLSRVMGATVSSASTPEPEDVGSATERIATYLAQKPLDMTNMLKVTRMISESSCEEKLIMFQSGVIHTIVELIAQSGAVDTGYNNNKPVDRADSSDGRKRRRRTSPRGGHRGVGYGHGSTRSRWDIERTVEERLAREEHLIWLLSALIAFVYTMSPDFSEDQIEKFAEHDHLTPPVVKLIGESAVVPLLEYHLKNDSVFDVSEHMEIYQALLEMAATMAMVPALVPYLVKPFAPQAKSVAKELVPKFKDVMASYPNMLKGQGSPDFRLIEFINKIERFSEVVLEASRTYETQLPPDERIKTASTGRPKTAETNELLVNCDLSDAQLANIDVTTVYTKILKPLQIQTWRFIGDYGKLVVPFSFKKEARNTNPYSPALKERTKRIQKEVASMPQSLPLNASNSIFVCVDEGRCDILKVLISGPDDTPYQNGLFEFDVFFPNSYPYSPPKCAFLTTGSGNVRFNPNLYNDGKICLSILGTWEGRPEEKWTPYCSLLQVLISIQGLIFVKEPYFNEPGFEKYQGTEKGEDYSRKYNLQIEHATLSYAIRDQLKNGPEYFKKVIQRHIWLKRASIIDQAKNWLAEMRKDVAESERNPKRKESVAFDAMYNPYSQERVIQSLISELQAMTCPTDGE